MDKFDNNTKAKQLLKKYLAGECSPEEEALVLRWYYSFSEDKIITSPKNTEQLILREARSHILKSIAIEARRQPRFFNLRFISAAAVILIVLTGGVIGLIHFIKPGQATVTYTEFRTASGERKEISLPDGSLLTLNAVSTVKIPSDFGVKDRTIALTGEAFFDVVHNKNKPFLVKTGDLITRDIGTSFDIKAYAADEKIQVAVLTGTVSVDSHIQNKIKTVASRIQRDQMLEYNPDKGGHFIRNVNAYHVAAWKNNELYFDAVTIPEIAKVLERKYNVNIKVAGSKVGGCLYTAKFDNEPIGKVLNIVADLTGATWTINKNQITINAKDCK